MNRIITFIKKGPWYRNAAIRAGIITSFLTMIPLTYWKFDLTYAICSIIIFGLLFILYGGQNKRWWN